MYPTKEILLIVFELKGNNSEYLRLFEFLKSHDGWSHNIPSTWLIATNKTPHELGEGIRKLVKTPGDRFIAVRLDQYWGIMPKEQSEWITKHRDLSRQADLR